MAGCPTQNRFTTDPVTLIFLLLIILNGALLLYSTLTYESFKNPSATNEQ